MLTPVLVVANSSSVQRGLAALVESSGDLCVAGRLSWHEPLAGEFAVVLAELEGGETADLAEPFVILCDTASSVRGPGRAFLARDAEDETVLCALRAVLLGLSVVDASHLERGPSPEIEDLTPRETEILGMLGDGFTNRQLAEALSISENTVKFHLGSIFSKLQVGSRAEAVTVGIRSGLVML